jgi:3-polyprenyl-4-hydroxybenzoate decarboxylase and related decarboxylases
VVITRDPELGINSGIYRFIVKEKSLTGIDIVTPNNMRMFAQRAYEQGRPLPISISIGTIRSRSPARAIARRSGSTRWRSRRIARRAGRAGAVRDHRSALRRRRRDRAGGGNPADRLDLAGRTLRRVHAADGRVHWNPLVRIKAISPCARMRSTTICTCRGRTPGCRAHALCRDPPGAATAGVQVKDINVTLGGCAFWHAVISIKKQPGEGKNALLAALSVMDLKHVVVVDDDIDVFDPTEVEWAIATRVQGDKDVMVVAMRAPSRSIRACRRATAWCRRGQGRHRRHHSGRHSARILRAHHLRLCRRAKIADYVSGKADEAGLAGDDLEVAALAEKILETIAKTPLYYTDIAERFSSYDFPHRGARTGPPARDEKLWQDPRGRMCVRGSEFAAKPPRR